MKKMEKYIKTRIEQLKEDKEKASDPHDIQWYNRCIQELDWALQMQGEPTHDCYMKNEKGTTFIPPISERFLDESLKTLTLNWSYSGWFVIIKFAAVFSKYSW